MGYVFVQVIVSSFHRAAQISLICNESYQQSPEKTKNNSKNERQN